MRDARDAARAARRDAEAAEEELRLRARARAVGAQRHAAEIERWRGALGAARADAEMYRQRNSHEALATQATAAAARYPPLAATRAAPPPPEPAAAEAQQQEEADPLFGGNGLLDRIVLSRHWDYFMEGRPPKQQQQN